MSLVNRHSVLQVCVCVRMCAYVRTGRCMCVCVFLGKIAVGSGMLQKLCMNVYMWPVLVEDISLQTGKSKKYC